jgi:hypothetical protein
MFAPQEAGSPDHQRRNQKVFEDLMAGLTFGISSGQVEPDTGMAYCKLYP